jgi:hypothetical protein
MKLVGRNSEAAFIETAGHVRHDPPWQIRASVTTGGGWQSRWGITVEGRRCDRGT